MNVGPGLTYGGGAETEPNLGVHPAVLPLLRLLQFHSGFGTPPPQPLPVQGSLQAVLNQLRQPPVHSGGPGITTPYVAPHSGGFYGDPRVTEPAVYTPASSPDYRRQHSGFPRF